MTGVDESTKRWENHVAKHRILDQTAFEDGSLMLGAATRLAKVGAPIDQPRVVALLAAAHGRVVAASSLHRIQRALEKRQDGDFVLALIHLALSGLGKQRSLGAGRATRH